MDDKTCCESCDDGEGNCAFPYYGVAPHACGFRAGLPLIGYSKELPESEWPANYKHDHESSKPNPGGYPGTGIYTYCINCGRAAAEIGRGM